MNVDFINSNTPKNISDGNKRLAKYIYDNQKVLYATAMKATQPGALVVIADEETDKIARAFLPDSDAMGLATKAGLADEYKFMQSLLSGIPGAIVVLGELHTRGDHLFYIVTQLPPPS